MVSLSASINLPMHHKVQKFSSGTGSPGWSRKKGHKTVVVSIRAIVAKIYPDKVVRWCLDGECFWQFFASCIFSEPRAARFGPAS